MSWNCLYPWKSIYVHPDGSIRPCCIQKIKLGETKNGDDILSVWNNDTAKKLREQFRRGEFVPGCEPCLEKEKNLGKSLRTSFRENILKDFSKNEIDFSKLPIEPSLDIEHLDLSFSNMCNLKCRFCGPYNSTSWFVDADQLLKNDREFWISYLGKSYELNSQKAETYVKIAESLTKLKRIEVKGGEPFLAREQLPFLEALIKTGRSQEIELTYTTNGTVILPDVQEFFPHFKQITISLSVDGVAELYQYIRGGRFRLEQEVEQNIEFYNQFKNLNMIIHFTVCAYNILNLSKMIEWAEKSKSIYPMIKDWQTGLVINPRPLQITRLPLPIRTLALSRLEAYPRLSKIRAILQQDIPALESQEWLKEFKKYTDDLDQLRQTSFLNLVPEFQTYWS